MQYLYSILNSRQYSCSVTQLFMLYCGPPQTRWTRADNAATCPAGAAIVATQSWAIKLYTYMYHELAGESLPYVDGPACHLCTTLTWSKIDHHFCFFVTSAMQIFNVEVAVHAVNNSAWVMFALSLIHVDVTVSQYMYSFSHSLSAELKYTSVGHSIFGKCLITLIFSKWL